MTRDAWIKDSQLGPGIAVGHILYEDTERIVLAMDHFKFPNQEEQFRVVSTYPKSGIKKIIHYTIKV